MRSHSARSRRIRLLSGLSVGVVLYSGCAGRELPPTSEAMPSVQNAVAPTSLRQAQDTARVRELPIEAPPFPSSGSITPPTAKSTPPPRVEPSAKEPAPTTAAASTPEPPATTSGPALVDESEIIISDSWFGFPIQELLDSISDQHNLQFFVSQLVNGAVTINAKQGMPLEKFLDNATAMVGATFKKIGPRTYFIASADAQSPSFSRIAESEVVTLRYISVTQLRTMLPDWAVEYVRLDTTEPYVVISAPPLMLQEVKRQIKMIDQPQKQVSIHALFVELNEDAGKQLGITWSWNATRAPAVGEGQAAPEHGISGFSVQRDSGGTFQDAFGLTLTGELAHQALLTLNSLETQGLAKIRSYPSVIAQNGKLSQLELGLEQYFRVEAGTVAFPRVEIEKIPSGVILKVTPQISDNGDITLALEPSVDDIVAVGPDGLPTIRKRKVTATVRIRDGETVVLGGLVEERDMKLVRKTPILGSLPIIGRLFRTSRTETVRKEVAIFITPRILYEK